MHLCTCACIRPQDIYQQFKDLESPPMHSKLTCEHTCTYHIQLLSQTMQIIIIFFYSQIVILYMCSSLSAKRVLHRLHNAHYRSTTKTRCSTKSTGDEHHLSNKEKQGFFILHTWGAVRSPAKSLWSSFAVHSSFHFAF